VGGAREGWVKRRVAENMAEGMPPSTSGLTGVRKIRPIQGGVGNVVLKTRKSVEWYYINPMEAEKYVKTTVTFKEHSSRNKTTQVTINLN